MVMPRLLSEVVEALKARPEAEALVLVGSRGEGGQPDASSDWNLWLLLNSPLPETFLAELLTPRSTLLEQDSQGETWGELNDGTVYQLVTAYWEPTSERLLGGLGGTRLDEPSIPGLWHAWLTGKVLWDRNGRFAALRTSLLGSFTEAVKQSVVTQLWPRLAPGLRSLRTGVVRALKRNDSWGVVSASTAFVTTAVELVYAVNGRPFPGPHRLALSETLPQKPSDWAGLLSGVDRALAGNRALLPQALDRMTAEVQSFLVRQGLLSSPVTQTRTPKEAPAPVPPAAPPSGVLTVYTDGGCIGNPGKGAWAFLVDDGVMRTEDTGGEPLTTNNKMELQAVIQALSTIAGRADWKSRPIRIHTDSQYVRNGITAWIKTWASNGWKTAAKEPVKNQDLWMELQRWDQALKPEWKWVKGHAGNPNNERCDQLVRRTMDQM